MTRDDLVLILYKISQEHKHPGDTFTLDPNHPVEMPDDAWKRFLEAKKKHSTESHWDDPVMDNISDAVNRAKKARPDLPDSRFPHVGKDLTANHPSYPGYVPESGANVLARTGKGVSGWDNVTKILKAQERPSFPEFSFPRHDVDLSGAGTVLAGAAGLIAARSASRHAYRYVKSKAINIAESLKREVPNMIESLKGNVRHMIPKMADFGMVYPALLATSMGVNAIKVMKDNKARQILETALAREGALKRKAVGMAVGAGAAGAGVGYVSGKKTEHGKKEGSTMNVKEAREMLKQAVSTYPISRAFTSKALHTTTNALYQAGVGASVGGPAGALVGGAVGAGLGHVAAHLGRAINARAFRGRVLKGGGALTGSERETIKVIENAHSKRLLRNAAIGGAAVAVPAGILALSAKKLTKGELKRYTEDV